MASAPSSNSSTSSAVTPTSSTAISGSTLIPPTTTNSTVISSTGMSTSASSTTAQSPSSTNSDTTSFMTSTTSVSMSASSSNSISTTSIISSSSSSSSTSSSFSSSSSSSSSSTTSTSSPTSSTTSSSFSTTSTTSTSIAIASVTPIIIPTTTLQSTIWITTTDGNGLQTSTAPSAITSLVTTTGSDGGVVTITQIQVNPTLSPNNKGDSASTAFFSNTGAVVGTFILVGITAASILLWIFFYVRRRRRRRRFEHDSAVSATLAAAGLYRTPLEDDDPHDEPKQLPYGASGEVEMNQRSASRVGVATVHSQPSNGRISSYYDAPEHEGDTQNLFSEFGVPSGRKDGYMPARTSSPDVHYRDRNGSTSTSGFVVGHSANQSIGSVEPLLASHNRRPSNGSPPSPTVPLAPLVASVAQNSATGPGASTPEENTNTQGTDARLDPNIRHRLENSGDNASVRDEEDYSRPVLLVRNLPDASSRES